MAKHVATHYVDKRSFLPEFLIICLLEYWLSEEEKAMNLYPFLKKIDFLELMSKFEMDRTNFERSNICTIHEIHTLSFKIIDRLKQERFKVKVPKKG